MLRSARMNKLKVIVLDQYAEDVIREFSKLGSAQIVDIKDSADKLEGVSFGTVNQEIADKASELLGRVYYLMDILDIKEERDFFGSLKDDPVKISWEDDKSAKQLERVEAEIEKIEAYVIERSDATVRLGEEKARLTPIKSVLESLSRLNIDVSTLGESQFMYYIAGSISPEDLDKLERKLKEDGIEFYLKETGNGDRISLLLTFPKQYRADVEKLLGTLDFQSYSLGEDVQTTMSLKEVRKNLAKVETEMERVEAELSKARKKYRDRLLGLREIVDIEKSIADQNNLMARTSRVYLLEGWVPGKDLGRIKERIGAVSQGHSLVYVSEPSAGEVPPTKFDNPAILKPFEMLVGTFGLPSYKEIDPTPIIAITFPLFFGLMFGDIGHGLMLVLLGIFAVTKLSKAEAVKNLGMILLICGIAAVFFGALYGEFFGLAQLDQKELLGFNIPPLLEKPSISGHGTQDSTTLAEHEPESEHEGGTDEVSESPETGSESHESANGHDASGVPHPLVNPIHEASSFMLIAFVTGALHIILGVLMDLFNLILKKEYFGTLARPIPRLWFYGGVIYLLLFVAKVPQVNPDGLEAGIELVVLLIFAPLVVILFGEIIHHLPKFHAEDIPANLGQGAFEVFDTCLLFLSNSISYGRIFALGLVHGGLFMAIYSVGANLAAIPYVGIVLWFLFIFVCTIAVVGLESLIVFLHSLRLHYYEWFNKFYGADGLKYVPFKAERVYSKLNE